MDAILQAGIELIVAIQQAGAPALRHFFEVFTGFGGRHYLYLVPLLVWCVDFRLGVRVCLAMAATLLLNTSIKEWIAQPRPFELDARIVSDGEAGYGLPSGHAQLVVVFWGLWASWAGRRWAWAVAVVVMGAMGFSRVYLGVHFPSDVIAGWALGALTLWLVLRYQSAWAARIAAAPATRIAAVVAGAVLAGFAFDWLAVRDHDHLNAGSIGFFGGSALGALFSLRRGVFDGAGPVWQRALRYALGMTGALLLLGVMRRIGLPAGDAAALAVVTLDLFVFGLWVTGGAPWLFERVRLAPAPIARVDASARLD